MNLVEDAYVAAESDNSKRAICFRAEGTRVGSLSPSP